jgi:serine-type D-Ala-D-Ala carboxypeptidase (penicillin-binding protein 5/6)
MSSPLQGGKKRGVNWEGPTLARRPPRRRWPRRVLGVAAGLVAGIAGWLTLGVDQAGESARLGSLSVVPDQGPPKRRDQDRKRPDRRERVRAEAASVAVSLPVREPLPVKFKEPPEAGIVFDMKTGETLWRRSPTEERPIASLTKIMSAVLVAEEVERPGRRIKVGPEGAGLGASGGTLGSAVGLEPGMRVGAGALFHAMLVASANDASTALAVHTAGSADRFVERMNDRARLLGLECTDFVSPHGLEPGNRSCAADLAALTRLAMEEPRVARVARKERAVVKFPIEGGERHLATTNPLLQAGYEGTVGLKTGYTQDAGSSLAAVVRRDGRAVGAVLLDSPDLEGQAEQLLDAAFEQLDRGNRSKRRR